MRISNLEQRKAGSGRRIGSAFLISFLIVFAAGTLNEILAPKQKLGSRAGQSESYSAAEAPTI